MRTTLTFLLAALAAAACSDATAPTSSNPSASAAGSAAVGGVFTQTNDVTANAVVAFARHADGSLSHLGTYPTGGRGIGGSVDPLVSQGALALTPNERFLIAVNAGSDELTSFAVDKGGLSAVDVAPSGGSRPVSVAATNHIAYALNVQSNTLTGFLLENDGRLTPVPAWTRTLTGGGGAEALFSRDGRTLIVVERASSSFDVFPVNPDGSLGTPVASPSVGAGPFGFDVTPRGQVIASEPGPRAASSYDIGRDGALRVVSASVTTAGQAAPCWVIVTNSGRFAYTANAGSGTISGFAVGADGSLALITPDGRTGDAGAGSTPLDMDVSRDSRFLYVLEAGTGNIGAFAIAGDGTLAALADTPALPARSGQMGLAAY